uniref:Cadherin domain-containing protein n=1 Tax=Lates calcarifer TaxID=8187 RepID=A0A4W6FXJ7_LATCA
VVRHFFSCFHLLWHVEYDPIPGAKNGLYQITVEITDINDHSPTFKRNSIHFEISESANTGSRFPLTSAEDPDVGVNGLREYFLTENDNFVLKQNSNPLDRETNPHLSLKLIAVDGGSPQRSGTVNIDVTVLDINDNAPVFNQSVYKATVMENSPRDTYVTTVNASDADIGSNSIVTYYFSDLNSGLSDLFRIDEKTGVISITGSIDYEKDKKYELRIEGKDQGGLTDSSKVIIEVTDVNDNAPTISVMSFTSPVSEDSPPGTTIGIINVKDLDSSDNGQVNCRIEQNAPFKIKSNLRNYYTLVTDIVLDRESVSDYNITVVATDAGMPPLSTKRTFHLKVSDVNDNAPVFPRGVYSAFIPENNSPGVSVLTVRAKDPDENQNARISYILEDTNTGGSPVSEYVSINAESGVIHAVRSFDYEQIKQLVFIVKAQDGGSPPLSSNVTVKILIHDQNDNPPQVLYPVQTGGSLVAEMVPRSADVGYLVTKVVAVDVDSGQNAWLSYKLQKATDRALFEVGLQNGEIRTIRQVTDKDAVKQRLTVIVEDNGQPSRSATVIVNVAVADSFPEVLSEFTDFTQDKEYNDNLTFYLVLALAVVSFLFITCLYTELKTDKGILVVNERIDREQLCGDVTPCSFSFEMILENPMELHHVTIEVLDVNDHPPVFKKSDIMLDISESANIGARFVLDSAEDPDVGVNGLQNYVLTSNDNFVLKQHVNPDGSKYAEIVLQKQLDREKVPSLSLKLIAVDGGNPQRSGTVNINIVVLDANDNAPVFNQSVYKATVIENAAKGTKIVTVNATDVDSGSNGYITYSISNVKSNIADLLDKKYELRIDAKDQGGLTDSSKVIIEVTDVNDNAPTISVMSFTSPVSEDSPPGTTIGIINVKDLDSSDNGQVNCRIEQNAPFKIKSNLRNYYTLVTDTVLDRESVSDYNITVVATDAGMPPLSTKRTFHLKVSDVNDNSPVFSQGVYSAFIAENNSPGVSLVTVRAKDPDENQNARISYILEDSDLDGSPVSQSVCSEISNVPLYGSNQVVDFV